MSKRRNQKRRDLGPGLVLAREINESCVLRNEAGEIVIVTVIDARPGCARLHFSAPKSVQIDRQEVFERRGLERRDAA
jgi:carbon storage regulator CsrA